MRRLSVLFVAVAMCGCTMFGRKKTASGWVVLDRSEAVECARWPLRDKDLGIEELFVVHGAKPAFLASGVRRDGSPMHLYAPFEGDVKIDKESLRELPLGRAAVLFGGLDAAGDVVAAVGQNGVDKAALEVRAVKDNVVRLKTELAKTNVVGGVLTPVKSGAWLAFKKEDTGYGLAHLDLSAKGKAAAKVLPEATFADAPVVVPQTTGTGALAFVREGETGSPFKARAIGADGTVGPLQGVELSVASQAESWSAATHMGSHYLAVVDGDSLIGQANLRVAALGWGEAGASVKWTKDAPLKDVHVTEPFFLQTGKGLQILLLNWVDEESTIARYIVAGGTLGQPTYSGIFPKGARIVDAFVDGGEDTYVVVRYRDDTRWTFQICRI